MPSDDDPQSKYRQMIPSNTYESVQSVKKDLNSYAKPSKVKQTETSYRGRGVKLNRISHGILAVGVWDIPRSNILEFTFKSPLPGGGSGFM